MTHTTATVIYRRTKAGEWVAFGPADAIRSHSSVTVTKRSGQTETRTVVRCGKTFRVDGVEMRYGYLLDRDADTPVDNGTDSGTYIRTADIPVSRGARDRYNRRQRAAWSANGGGQWEG